MELLKKSSLIVAIWKQLERSGACNADLLQKASHYEKFGTTSQYIHWIFCAMFHFHSEHEKVANLLIALKLDGVYMLQDEGISFHDKLLDTDNLPKLKKEYKLPYTLLRHCISDDEAKRYHKDFGKVLPKLIDNESIMQKTIIQWYCKQVVNFPLRRICKVLHVSQKELASRMGVSEVSVNRWASNESQIPLVNLRMFDLLEANVLLQQKLEKTQRLFDAFEEIKQL